MQAKTEPLARMTKPERATLIAKDALRWIKEKRLYVATGRYISGEDLGRMPIGASLKAELVRFTPEDPCQVCALGACFLASVDRFNKVKVGFDLSYGTIAQFDHITKHLGRAFSEEQLLLIECAFEMKRADNLHDLYSGTIAPKGETAAMAFGGRYNDDTERLVAILRNIVRNKGMFCPPRRQRA